MAVWELTLKFPEFPHINFRTSARRQSGQLPARGQHEGEVVSLGSVSRLALFHGKYTRGMSQGQGLYRVQAWGHGPEGHGAQGFGSH